ncbi:MAG: autotransporter outer membrane beta-barrel domain-containing protein [Gammaproteobacteria bacterium]|nr:autotransporter outer membrane beta-barrel domain-containing protein [Gammaproteobacteria bacterium]MDH3848485.1 autotransporter outer membrane beta-barrel domain-containing protein [Gammaproteobacteria bacterium]MDH3864552.1 autotransporter outer membrane beta-barrel domain-containing protein [Gammaproteobacteria bacterium]
MNSGYFSIGEIRRFAATVGVAAVSLLFALDVSAQNQIPDFIENQGLTNTNLGRSALAVQRTCGRLAQNQNLLDPSGTELFLRCNELVVTAADRDTGTAPTERTLNYSTDQELLAAFQQVNGEEVQASANLSQTASYDQFSTIGARLEALRGGSSASVTSVAANGGEFMYGSGGGAAADSAASPFGPWGWFVRGTYTSGERDPSEAAGFAGQENGFDYTQYGFTVGIDRRNGNEVWGFALGYNNYEVDMQNAAIPGIDTPVVEGGKIETDSVNGTFFYDLSSQNDVYFSLLAGYGTQSFDMARNFIYFSNNTDQANTGVVDQQRFMSAAPDGDSLSAALTLGRAFYRGSVVFDPYIGLTYDRVTIDRFAEVDSGNGATGPDGMQLAFDEQTIDSVRSRVGIQLSNNFNTSFGSIRPMFSAEWFHEFEDKPRVIRAKYALEDALAEEGVADFSTGFGDCVSCFDLVSEAPETDYFVVGLGIGATTQRGFQSFLMLEGLLGHSYLSAYAVTVGLRGQF